MATYQVTTGADIVDANDGVLSLREAVAAAQAHAGADVITFALPGNSSSEAVVLTSSLKIAAGNNLTINGASDTLYSNVVLDGNYKGDPFTTDGFTMIEVASGANVTLMNLDMTNGFERGKSGTSGSNGTDGLDGNDGKGDTGLPGSNGNGGTSGTSATSDGLIAVAGIQNAGNLTLDRVNMIAMNGSGGSGGSGGNGGDGGDGGKGAPDIDGVGGGGGAGGHAGDGGNGTDGGAAVGAIYNLGTLTLLDTTISLTTAYGGDAGAGGEGGHGGTGGTGGNSAGKNHGGYGGYGGDGGKSGSSGNGGDAAGAILNAGTILSKGTLVTFGGLENAGNSFTVPGGSRGGGGQGGKGDPRGDNGVSGTAGSAGAAGKDGVAADATHILGSHGQAVFAKSTFIVDLVATDTVREGQTIQFAVERLGDASTAATVNWSVGGLGAADFTTGQQLSGTASFGVNETVKFITLNPVRDGLVEGPETFAVSLKGASAGTALGAHISVQATVTDENHPPSSFSISKNTVADNAAVNSVVGKLTGSDPDGDSLAFSLVSNPGSYFKIVDGNLAVAKALDTGIHSYSLLIEANDGNGASLTKTVTVRLAGYIDGHDYAETLEGTSGVDHIFGYGDADKLYGYAGRDYLYGGLGADILDGGGDIDRMEGGAGNDTYIVDNSGDFVVETAGNGTADRVAARASYALSAGADIEYMATTSSAGTSAINLTGNALRQDITGNAGNNVLSDGGKGGADVLKGLGGNDIYVVYNAADVIVETASQGDVDRVSASVSYRLGAGVHVEQMTTTSSAGISPISLTGNEFAQMMTGNAGDNRLEGREGNDTLRGLGGDDTFVFNTKLGASNVDTIVDFNVADDRFLLSDAVFKGLNTGVLASGYFRANTTGLAQDSNDHIIYETDTGKLFYDADGLGGAAGIQFAKIAVGLSLTNADFSVA
jgi:Ca2+-binding RTX toxin-like protein